MMRKDKKWLLAIGVATMMSASSAVMVFAATPNQQNNPIEQNIVNGKMHPMPGHGPMDNQKLLELLQIDGNTMRTEHEAGKTLVVIANEHGVSEETLKNFIIEDMTQHIDKDVQSGRISTEQGIKMKADMEQHVSKIINDLGPRPGEGRPMPGHGPMDNPKLLALLQIDGNTMRTEREAGKTLVAIANEHGVSEQTLKDVMIEDMTQHIDKDVQSGRISTEQATKMKADMEEHVSKRMNDLGPKPGDCRPMPGQDRPLPGPGPMDNDL